MRATVSTPPPNLFRATPRRAMVALTGLTFALGITGCTPSTGTVPKQSGVVPSGAAVTVVLPSVAEGAQPGQSGDPQSGVPDTHDLAELDLLAEHLASETGIAATIVADSSLWQEMAVGAEPLPDDTVLLGLTPADAEPADEPYGHDYACVVANRAWFATNQLSAPTTLGQLADPQWAPLWQVPAPSEDPVAQMWLGGQAAADAPGLLDTLRAAYWAGAEFPPGVTVPADGAQSGAQSGAAPSAAEPRILIRSALYPWQTVNNLGTDSQWATLDSTCVGFTMSARSSGDDASRLVDYLLTDSGQQALLEAGLVYPLTNVGAAQSQAEHLAGVGSVAPEPEGALPTVTAADWDEVNQAATAVWAQLLGNG